MRKIMTLAAALFAMALFTGCKYEEGPAISLRSKTSRVANVWRVEKVLKNGTDVTGDYDSYEETYEKDGDYSLKIGGTFSIETSGKWEFQNKHEEIRIYDAGAADRTTYILRLKENEFWYYYYDGSDKYEVRLKSKT